jgi:hypothetical protein
LAKSDGILRHKLKRRKVNGIQCPHGNGERLQGASEHWPDHFNHRNAANQIPHGVAMRILELMRVDGADLPSSGKNAGVGKDSEQATGDGSDSLPAAASQQHSPSRKVNGHRGPRRKVAAQNGSADSITSGTAAQQPVTPLSKPLRLRDRDHLKFVSAQPCLACGRSPSDAHHLKFAQQRALGRKVSDEFTVPLCRTHHRELHQGGDELTWWHHRNVWWHHRNVDPMPTAQRLWRATHRSSESPTSISALPHPGPKSWT